MPCSAAGGDVMGSGLSYHSPAATLCVLPPAPSSFRSEEGGPRAGYKYDVTVRRRGRGPEVRLSRLPAASLPRVPAHLSPVASSPWWCRACAVPIARFLRAAARLRPLLIYLVLQSGRPPLYAADESCSEPTLAACFRLCRPLLLSRDFRSA